MANAEFSAAGEMPRTEVDERTLARVCRCDPENIRRYARTGLIRRSSRGKYPLFESIGALFEHLRQIAMAHGMGDAMKAGAALKDAQRRLAEARLAKLDGEVLSMAEVEALWGDLAAASKWLFLSIPKRARPELNLSNEQEARLAEICITMLRQVAFQGQMQLPTDKGDAEEEEDGGQPSVAEQPNPR